MSKEKKVILLNLPAGCLEIWNHSHFVGNNLENLQQDFNFDALNKQTSVMQQRYAKLTDGSTFF